MVDGKTLNVLTDNKATLNCFICGSTPTLMNDIDKAKARDIKNVDYLAFGISPLHCWLRCFEFIIHLSYRLPFKKWQISRQYKEVSMATKIKVQNELRDKLGILVDFPVPGGTGNTNT
jgi:hypothetical protein